MPSGIVLTEELPSGIVTPDSNKATIFISSTSHLPAFKDDVGTVRQLGSVLTTGAHSARPSAGHAGDLYLPNDGYAISLDDGAAWKNFGPIFPFVTPSDSGFAWINQGSSTIITTKDALVLTGAATGNAANAVARVKTAPATPYTITAFFRIAMYARSFNAAGLCFRQSSDGKMILHGYWGGSTSTFLNMRTAKYTNATTFSADYQNITIQEMTGWLRIVDDGTNRKCLFSADGQNWIEHHTVGRTDFLTADQVGIFVSTENAVTPNVAPIATLLSWQQS